MISLQSGSNGNCIYVESGDVRLFFDAGISGSQAQERLAAHGRTPESVDALFISHDHSDHIRCAGVFTRKFGLPLYATERTLVASRRRMALGAMADVHHFRPDSSVKIRHVTVEAIRTPHDATEGVVFVVDDGKNRLGICTDLGHVFGDMRSLVRSVDGLFLEFNYDPIMLEKGDYPASLKRRIRGLGGHISNQEAADLVADNASDRLKWLCMAHLSEENNSPELAMSVGRSALGPDLPIYLGSRYRASDAFVLNPHHRLERVAAEPPPLERFFGRSLPNAETGITL